MALKFRRGTTAQQSGSLAFGEPYVNTTLGTLLIGGPNGDIVLSATGTGSTGNFGAISGSGLDITGNANIAGNLTLGGQLKIGDNTSDTVNVIASLSSSLIPSDDNVFNVGRSDRRYAGVFANYLRATYVDIQAPSGSEVRIKNNLANTEYHVRNTNSGSFEIYNTTGKAILFATSASATQDVQVIINDALHVNGDLSAVDISAGTLTGSLSGSVFGIGNVVTYSSSVNSRLGVVENISASAAAALNSFSASNAVTDNTQTTNITTVSASAAGAFASASAFSASAAVVDAGQDTLISSLRTNILSASVFTTFSTSVDSRLDSVELVSASAANAYAKLSSANTFNGNQTISGSLFVTQDLVLGGSASIQHITSSQLNIGDNIITVNTINPTVRFGGLAVNDSGSAGISGSLLYDSVQDEWVFVHKGNGTNVTSSHVVMGPETYDNLGNETYLTANRIPKSKGNEHLNDSNITDTGTLITLGSNTSVTGTLVATGTSLVSASAQITLSSTTGYSTFSSSLATRDAGIDTTVNALSSSVNSRLLVVEAVSQSAASALNSFSASNAATDATQTTNITTATQAAAGAFASASAYSASAAVVDAGQDTLIASLRTNVVSASVFTTFSTSVDSRLDSVELVSASAAGALNNVSGAFATTISNLGSTYATDAELSAVSSAMATRDNGQDTTISTLSSSVASRLGTLETKDISVTLTGDVTGTGTITDLGNVSFATTIAANSVALGTDTTGNYVASLVQGTGVTITNNSGEGATPTIAIGQAVATSDNVRFNSLGIGMAASATAGRIDAANDIVAFSSSDRNFKENITPIENPIDKIRKISGNTYDWKAELKDVHGYEGNDVGVIAQEIEAVLPQLVQTRENGYKAVKYDKLVALLIEGMKEQQLQIEQLRIDLDNCRNKGL